MMKWHAALILAVAAVSLAACNGLYGDDEFARYLQRSDNLTLSAGDAKEVNIATHTIHPWPPGVGDPRIAANGERMQRAIDRYRAGPGAASDKTQAVGEAVGWPVHTPTTAPGGAAAGGAAAGGAAPGGAAPGGY
jgi:hypothetical protein